MKYDFKKFRRIFKNKGIFFPFEEVWSSLMENKDKLVHEDFSLNFDIKGKGFIVKKRDLLYHDGLYELIPIHTLIINNVSQMEMLHIKHHPKTTKYFQIKHLSITR